MLALIRRVMRALTRRRLSRFIVIEGIDGSGKTVQVRLLCRALRTAGYRVHETREPTGGPIGQVIRRKMSPGRKRPVNPVLLQMLFVLDRLHHLVAEILPHLERGEIVISDRYFYSTIAYGVSDRVPRWLVVCLNGLFPRPAAALLVDVRAQTGLSRILQNRQNQERFEAENYLAPVVQRYHRMVRQERLHPVNGEPSIEEVEAGIRYVINFFLPAR